MPSGINVKSIKKACELTKPTHIFAVPAFWESIVSVINTKCDTDKKRRKLRNAFKLSYSLQNNFGAFGNYLVRNCLFKKYLKQIFGSSIKYCISGGAFISDETLKTINLLGYRLVNGYGSTEIGITSLCNSNKIKNRIIPSIGKPFEFVEYKIENSSLFVKSSSTSKHLIDCDKEVYINDEYVDTNDAAKVEKDKYFLLGREDEIVIGNNGENLSIALIEKQLFLPLAKEFTLLASNNKIILVASYDKSEKIDKVIEELEKVSKTKVGSHISSIYYTNISFEKANSIKVKRGILLKQLQEFKNDFIPLKFLKEHTEEISNEINDGILQLVINAFKTVFPDSNVTRTTNFYNDLGGDSLKYYVLLSEIETKLGRGLEINIENPPLTPEEFVNEIEK